MAEIKKIIHNGVEYTISGGGTAQKIKYIAVGGGGGGGCMGGGGGGGEVCFGEMWVNGDIAVTIGAGGLACAGGGDTTMGDITARGGCGGVGCTGGASGSGKAGGTGVNYYCAGSGGGAKEAGHDYTWVCYLSVKSGGRGFCGYGGGGNSGGCLGASCFSCGGQTITYDGGGQGGGYRGTPAYCGCDATNYGGGGGGSFNTSYAPGKGCQGVVDICYPAQGQRGINCASGGDCCFECYCFCVHRFTSNGTFTIIS